MTYSRGNSSSANCSDSSLATELIRRWLHDHNIRYNEYNLNVKYKIPAR